MGVYLVNHVGGEYITIQVASLTPMSTKKKPDGKPLFSSRFAVLHLASCLQNNSTLFARRHIFHVISKLNCVRNCKCERERERERGTERQRDRERGKQRFTFLGKARRTGFAIRAGGAPQQKAAGHMAPSSSSESSSEDDSGSDTDGVTAKPPPTKKPKRVEGADEEGSSEDDGLPRSHDVEQKAGGRENRTTDRVQFQSWVRTHRTVLNSSCFFLGKRAVPQAGLGHVLLQELRGLDDDQEGLGVVKVAPRQL